MPPRARAAPAAGADDSDDDLLATTTAQRTTTANRKMPKAKAAARRVSVSRTTAKRKAAPKPTRQALQDRTNLPDGHDTEEVDEFEEGDAPAKPQAKRAKTTATRKTVKEDKEDAPVGGAKKSARGRPPKRVISPEPMMTIPETQQDPEPIEEDIEQSIEMDPENMEIAKEPTPKQLSRYAQRAPSVPLQPLPPRPSARAASAQPVFPPIRSRSGSVNAAERRGGDPELRRQLNDLTKRHENLQLKYENLQEIGQTSAETNFERLKRASDQKAKDANELIAALRKEVAELRKTSTHVSSETTALQKQVTTLTATNEKISVERNDLKEKLQLSQNSVKALEAKLQAARQQISNAAQEAKAQEAKKTNAGSLTASDAQKEMKMKENLYADLTGLLISSVKRVDGEDVYNCIQTGRNGTLQFQLSVGHDASTPHPKTPSGLTYEEAEFAYEPVLDESRDRELLELLPDYLTEEICFPRNHAQRFYSKVVESMTRKIVVEEDDE